MTVKYHYNRFPPQVDQVDLQNLTSPAYIELGRYDGLLSAIRANTVLLSPLFLQEVVDSSRIEGTQSSLSEVLEYEEDKKSKKFSETQKDEMAEIINYRRAIEIAIEMMDSYPLSQRIIKESHRILMQGVRGKNKSPGEYRRVANWIGSAGQDINMARFIPISPEQLPDAMSQWERYIHQDDGIDPLVKLAILHVEFEALHPFLDGNGRLGRMFIPIFLADKKIIQKPYFYMSSYFERNRQKYYDSLLAVSKNNDWTQWCKFFLTGVIEEARNNYNKAQKILNLYDKLKIKIPEITKSQYSILALDYIFSKPHFSSTQFCRNSNIPKPTAQRLIRVFQKENILITNKGKGRKPSFHIFSELLNIAEGRDVL